MKAFMFSTLVLVSLVAILFLSVGNTYALSPEGSPSTGASSKLANLVDESTKNDQSSDLLREEVIVRIIIKMAEVNAPDLAELERHAFQTEIVRGDLIQGRVPLTELGAISSLEFVQYVRAPALIQPHEVISEGVSVIKADVAKVRGLTGENVKVAVLDVSFDPQNPEISDNVVETRSFRADGAIKTGDTRHGTAISEIVVDVAPSVDLYLYAVQTDLEFLQAVDFSVSKEMDLILISSGFFNVGPYDGTSLVSAGLDEARAAGILPVVSAGNNARSHWQGSFQDVDNDSFNEFSPSVDTVSFTAKAGEEVKGFLSWDDWPTSKIDYDLFLLNENQKLIASSTKRQSAEAIPPAENISYKVPTDGRYHFSIKKIAGESTPELDLFVPGFTIEPSISEGSIANVADSEGAITVGATNWADDSLEIFSSRGPTDDGRIKPDMAAPDRVTTAAYGQGSFGGTSASAPHVAGLAALLLHREPGLSPDALQLAIESSSVDLGPPGKDNSFGAGRANLRFLSTIVLDQNQKISPMIVDGEELQPSDFPATFSWEEGSTHTLSLSKPILDQGNGTRRVLLSWSDGFLESSREFTVGPSISLSAVFKTQYFVRVSGPSEAGSLPPDDWHDVAELVELSTSRELSSTDPLTRQIFEGWIIDGKLNQENPFSLQVKGPHDIVASYVLQHFVALRSDYGSAQGSGWYEADSVATISIESTTEIENGTRRAFGGWLGDFIGNQPTALVIVDAPKNIEAQWLTEFFVDVESPYGNPVGSGWRLADSVVEISLPEIVDQGNNTRRTFDHWNGDSTLTTHKINLKVDSSKFVSATWKTEYFVEVESNGGQIRGDGWYTSGDLTAIEAITPSTLVPEQTRLIFLGWSGDVEESTQKLVVPISSPLNLHANWRPQHYLTISSEGSVDTASKWIDEGQTVTVTAQSISNEKPREFRLLFEFWQGSAISDGPEITLGMDEPKKLEAIWKEQFFFSIHSNFGEPTGEGWYDKGSFATATISSPTGVLIKQVFTGWNGDLVSNDRHIMIEMNTPKSVTAEWTTDLTEFLLVFSVAAIAAGIMFVLIKRRADSK